MTSITTAVNQLNSPSGHLGADGLRLLIGAVLGKLTDPAAWARYLQPGLDLDEMRTIITAISGQHAGAILAALNQAAELAAEAAA